MAKGDRKPYTRRIQQHPCVGCGELTQRPKHCSAGCRERSRPPRPSRQRNPCGPIRQCLVCSKEFRRPGRSTRDSGKCCSRECGFELERHRRGERKTVRLMIIRERTVYARWARNAARRARDADAGKRCRDCGVVVPKGTQRCETCRAAATEANRRHARQRAKFSEAAKAAKRAGKARRKAIERGIHAERFDPFEIFERDKWRCHLCGCKTPKALRGTYQDRAPELDHIVPLSKGGQHTRTNTACSCRKCNGVKGDRPLGQLRLVA